MLKIMSVADDETRKTSEHTPRGHATLLMTGEVCGGVETWTKAFSVCHHHFLQPHLCQAGPFAHCSHGTALPRMSAIYSLPPSHILPSFVLHEAF